MSAANRKSKQVIESEIQYCADIAKRHFDMDLNYKTLEKTVSGLISEKIEDYFYQRFRDWVVADLMLLRDSLQDADKAAKIADKKAYKEKLAQLTEEAAGVAQD